jgi:hypothetical protein
VNFTREIEGKWHVRVRHCSKTGMAEHYRRVQEQCTGVLGYLQRFHGPKKMKQEFGTEVSSGEAEQNTVTTTQGAHLPSSQGEFLAWPRLQNSAPTFTPDPFSQRRRERNQARALAQSAPGLQPPPPPPAFQPPTTTSMRNGRWSGQLRRAQGPRDKPPQPPKPPGRDG